MFKKFAFTLAILMAAVLFAFTGSPESAEAQIQLDPITVTEEGKTSYQNHETYVHQFDVPEGYELVATLSGQWMEGHPNQGCTPEVDPQGHWSCDQNQPNEEIKVSLNGQVIYQSADQSPLDDQWFGFGGVPATVQVGFNELIVEHSGRPGSYGSVDFVVTLTVEPTPPQEEEPVFSLEAGMGCNNGIVNGLAEKPAHLVATGQDIYGSPITIDEMVEGEFSFPIDWTDPATTDPTVYSGSVTATLTYEGVVVKTADAQHNGACGEEPQEAPASCVVATANVIELPEEGAMVEISAIGDNAASMVLSDGHGMSEEQVGANVTWKVHAMPSTVFTITAVNPDGEPNNQATCTVDFAPEEPEEVTYKVCTKPNFDLGRTAGGVGVPGTIMITGQGLQGAFRWEVTNDRTWWADWPWQWLEADRESLWAEAYFLPFDMEEYMVQFEIINYAPGAEAGRFIALWDGVCHATELQLPEGWVAPEAPDGYEGAHVDTGSDADETVVEDNVNDVQVVESAETTMVATDGTYTVESGDTLWGIAFANGLSTDELVQANSDLIVNPAVISIGWVLTVPGN